MTRKTRVRFVEGIIEVEAAQDLKSREMITLNTYSKAIKHTKDSNTPKVGKALNSVKTGEFVKIKLGKINMPMEGEIWLNF